MRTLTLQIVLVGILAGSWARPARPQIRAVTGEIDLSQGSGTHLDPAAAVVDGRFVVAWRSLLGEGEVSLAARRIGPTGVLLGDPIPIDPQSVAPVGPPCIAGDSHGFTVARVAVSPDFCLAGQRFTPEGEPVAALDPTFCFAPDLTHFICSAAPLSDGGTALTWEEDAGVVSGLDIEMRRFGPDGHALGNRVGVVTFGQDLDFGIGDQIAPSIGTDRNDNVVVVWNSGGSGRRFDSENRILGPEGPIEPFSFGDGIFEVADTPLSRVFPETPAALGVLPSGDFVVAWQRDRAEEEPESVGSDVQVRRFTADATPRGPSFRIHDSREGDQTAPALAVDSRGNTVVVWRDQPADGGEATIHARQLNAIGEPRGPEVTVNRRPLGAPFDDPLINHGPTVALAEDGTFLVAWSSRSATGTDSGIAARLLRLGPSTDCTPSDTAFCLNQGRFRAEVTWEDFEGGRGPGHVVPVSADDSGLFWFFAPDNWEMLVKVIDGCPVDGHFWVFVAATTNVGWQLTVTDTLTGTDQTYTNPLRQRSPAVIDTDTFAGCPGSLPEDG